MSGQRESFLYIKISRTCHPLYLLLYTNYRHVGPTCHSPPSPPLSPPGHPASSTPPGPPRAPLHAVRPPSPLMLPPPPTPPYSCSFSAAPSPACSSLCTAVAISGGATSLPLPAILLLPSFLSFPWRRCSWCPGPGPEVELERHSGEISSRHLSLHRDGTLASHGWPTLPSPSADGGAPRGTGGTAFLPGPTRLLLISSRSSPPRAHGGELQHGSQAPLPSLPRIPNYLRAVAASPRRRRSRSHDGEARRA
jgi:hypothetical protein